MSNTRAVLECLKQSFSYIGEFTCAPINWAAGKYDKSDLSQNSSAFCCCAAVECMGKCIVRTPVAIVGCAVTGPVGIASAATVAGVAPVALTVAAVTDIPAVCCPAPSAPSMSR